MSTKWQKFSVDLSDYPKEDRPAIAVEIIDRIVQRTKDGKDKNGKKFAKYSEGYIHSKNFKIAGKSPGEINLTLSEDMLDSILVLDDRGGKVSIGFEKGSVENAKADGNIRGTFGKSKPVARGRDFLGISESELADILDNYQTSSEAQSRANEILTAQDNADRLSEKITVEDLEE